jgi:hypothetical protein
MSATPPPSTRATEIVRILRERAGMATEVRTRSGNIYTVFNIAWGQDLGDPEYHITSNISPPVSDDLPSDFFFTHEVALLRAPESGETLFASAGG